MPASATSPPGGPTPSGAGADPPAAPSAALRVRLTAFELLALLGLLWAGWRQHEANGLQLEWISLGIALLPLHLRRVLAWIGRRPAPPAWLIVPELLLLGGVGTDHVATAATGAALALSFSEILPARLPWEERGARAEAWVPWVGRAGGLLIVAGTLFALSRLPVQLNQAPYVLALLAPVLVQAFLLEPGPGRGGIATRLAACGLVLAVLGQQHHLLVALAPCLIACSTLLGLVVARRMANLLASRPRVALAFVASLVISAWATFALALGGAASFQADLRSDALTTIAWPYALLSLLPLGLAARRSLPWLFPPRATAGLSPRGLRNQRGRLAGGALFSAGGAATLALASGLVFWAGVCALLLGGGVACSAALRLFLEGRTRVARWPALKPFAALCMSVSFAFASLEAVLFVLERRGVASSPAATSTPEPEPSLPTPQPSGGFPEPLLEPEALRVLQGRVGVLTLPPEWRREDVSVPGARHAYRWHGALHVKDARGFRRSDPFPSKRPGVLRIVCLGDSLTYGAGVDARWIYPTLLEQSLAEDYRIEVLNLGVSGDQSEDMVRTLDYALELEPDLVLYGSCHNDFLPSGIGQPGGERLAYGLPLPASAQRFLLGRSRALRFVAQGYDTGLRRLGLRVDFYGDILDGFKGYRARFGRDLKELSARAQAANLPPIVGLVLDQFPKTGSRGHRLTQIAEEEMRAAGVDVIPTDAYYERYEGRSMSVSRWEGHPDEEAHAVFAAMFRQRLIASGLLEASRR